MDRQDAMATIDAALSGTDVTEQPEDTTGGISPQVALGVETPDNGLPKMTQDEKRAFDASRQASLDRQKLLDDAMNQEKKDRDAFRSSASQTVNAASRIVKGTGVKLAALPTPGSIVLPLVVLAIFFLLLLPVNGQTRFMWLWLTITGNAHITQGSGASDQKGTGTAGGPTDTLGTPGTGTAPPVTPPGGGTIAPQPPPSQPILPLVTFTGVEDIA